MRAIRRLAARVLGLRKREERDDDLARELAAHLDMAVDENVRRGMSPQDARRAALIASGGIESAKEAYRDERGIPVFEILYRDVRFAIRSLRKSAGFTAAVTFTLALAIGANTAIFSAVEAVLVRPLPVPHLDRVVTIGKHLNLYRTPVGLQAAEVFDLESRRDLFDAVAGYRNIDVNLTGTGNPQRIAAATTTAAFFDVFAVQPYLGRLYDRSVIASGATHVVVLSYGLWWSLTGGDRNAIGTHLSINDSTYTLAAVLPPGFDYPVGVQLWTPQALDPLIDRRASPAAQHLGFIIPSVGRMRAGMTVARLQLELTATQRGWAERFPEFYSGSIVAEIEAQSFVDAWAGNLRPILILLIGAAALVLLISCANIASLQLVRTTGRMRELALRAALGASRTAIARQQIIESLLLAIGGGALGTALGQLLVTTAGHAAAERIPQLQGLRLDPWVFACSVLLTGLAAVLFGTVPATRALRVDASRALASSAARSTSATNEHNRFLTFAVVAQVAIALMLILSCGVALRSLARLIRVDPGFDPTGVVTARLVLPPSRYPMNTVSDAHRVVAFHRELLARLRQMPGVDEVSQVDVPPFGYRGDLDAMIHGNSLMRHPGDTVSTHKIAANSWRVDANYFRAMRIGLQKGSTFSGREVDIALQQYPNAGAIDVVIDETLAQNLFADENPIGAVFGYALPGFRVVGVVAPVRKTELATPQSGAGTVYFPNAETLRDVTLIVRSHASFDRTVAMLRNAVRESDRTLPLFDITTMDELVQRSLGSRALASQILTGFAVVALFLALLGIYGVLSYTTSQRTKEIGIRLALGAEPRDVRRMVVSAGGRLAATGMLVGGAGFVGFARVLSSLTYGVSAHDSTTIVALIAVLMICALIAAVVPAVRASRVDVVDALRAD